MPHTTSAIFLGLLLAVAGSILAQLFLDLPPAAGFAWLLLLASFV